jgi:hypothetical protein
VHIFVKRENHAKDEAKKSGASRLSETSVFALMLGWLEIRSESEGARDLSFKYSGGDDGDRD